ncbi:MAG: hypothetical protein HW407_104 [Bacteroidetes bacterium]|nr:hypothetical protein [Bacteroidota bacterium]
MFPRLRHSGVGQFLDVTGENAYLGTRFGLTAGGFPVCFSEELQQSTQVFDLRAYGEIGRPARYKNVGCYGVDGGIGRRASLRS